MARTARRLALPFALLVALSGCDTPTSPEATRPVPQAEPIAIKAPEAVVQALAPYRALAALEVQGAVKLESVRDDFSLSVRTHILVAREARLRLLATKGLGMEVLFLTMVGDSLDVWLPREKTLYRGRLEDLMQNKMDFHPEEFVEQLLLPTHRLLGHTWSERVDPVKQGEAVFTEERPGARVHRLTISTATGTLLRRELLEPDGTPYLVAEFSRYRPLRNAAEGTLFPHRIHVRFPQEERQLRIMLRRAEANPPLEASFFRFIAPGEAAVKPFDATDGSHVVRSMRQALEADEEGAIRGSAEPAP